MERFVKPLAAGADGERDLKLDDLWLRSSRSIVASGKAVTPTAAAEICAIQGFQTWEQTDEYELAFAAFYDTAAGLLLDIEIQIGGQHFYTVPMMALANAPVYGTLYLTPTNQKISLNAIVGSASATYVGSLAITRLQQGFRVG